MKLKAYFGLPIVAAAIVWAAPSWGQQGATPQNEKGSSKAPLSRKHVTPKPGEKLYASPGVKRGGEPRISGPAFDFWWPVNGGGFHLNGQTGRAIFLWGEPYDVDVTYEYDATLVTGDEGFVYWATGWYFEGGHKMLLWLSSRRTRFCNNLWEIKYSPDGGDTFHPLSCSN